MRPFHARNLGQRHPTWRVLREAPRRLQRDVVSPYLRPTAPRTAFTSNHRSMFHVKQRFRSFAKSSHQSAERRMSRYSPGRAVRKAVKTASGDNKYPRIPPLDYAITYAKSTGESLFHVEHSWRPILRRHITTLIDRVRRKAPSPRTFISAMTELKNRPFLEINDDLAILEGLAVLQHKLRGRRLRTPSLHRTCST